MQMKIETTRWAAIKSAWQQAPKLVKKELGAAIIEAELYLQREIQERTPVGAQGFLRQSIFPEAPVNQGDVILGIVGSPLRYAESVELGTKPHWAPIQPLIDWVEQKLGIDAPQSTGVAKRIQYKIAHKGTQGAFMFKEAFEFGKGTVDAIFERRVNGILTKLAGQA